MVGLKVRFYVYKLAKNHVYNDSPPSPAQDCLWYSEAKSRLNSKRNYHDS